MANACYTCLRRTFCWLNIIIWLCSGAILGAGVWLYLSYRGYATLLPDHLILSADTLFMSVGGVGLVTSFLGCCGAWLQSRCLLSLYLLVIMLLFLSEFLIGAMAFVFRGGLSRTLVNELQFGIDHHYNISDRGSLIAPSVASIWDNIQDTFECCGVQSYEDWYKIQQWPEQQWVPESCCRAPYSDQRAVLTEGSGDSLTRVDCGKSGNPELWWDQGCVDSLQEWFTERLNLVGAVGLGIAIAQLLGILISMILSCSIKCTKGSDSYKSYSPTADGSSGPRSTNWED